MTNVSILGGQLSSVIVSIENGRDVGRRLVKPWCTLMIIAGSCAPTTSERSIFSMDGNKSGGRLFAIDQRRPSLPPVSLHLARLATAAAVRLTTSMKTTSRRRTTRTTTTRTTRTGNPQKNPLVAFPTRVPPQPTLHILSSSLSMSMSGMC